jgi:2,4-dienoyl-CoA reductase-like NADH-dependent reductase (Old Yellow Enzyme family)
LTTSSTDPPQQRTDAYGGPLANRARLLLSIVQAIRGVIPSGMPLLVRISATEWMEWSDQPSWDLAQSKELALLLADRGVDLLDVSSGGNHPQQKLDLHPNYQIDLAGAIRAELRRQGKGDKMAIGAVGMISTAEMARSVVQEDGTLAGEQNGAVEVEGDHGTSKADLVLVARQFLREPEFVLKTAALLGVQVAPPVQYFRAPFKKHRL